MSSPPAAALPAGDSLFGDFPDGTISGVTHLWPAPPCPPPDDEAIGGFIDAEASYLPDADYVRRCRYRLIDLTARQDAINWILKVHSHYEFRPVTAFLSVNYFDRFLSCCSLPTQVEWEYHLVAVACLSLAAKMEEIEVPYFMDLQLVDPTFVSESKIIQRMELCVMDRLKWRLHSIKPFDYLHYFISKLSFAPNLKLESMTQLFSSASNLILNATLVIEFLGFAPSTIAAATVLCLSGECQSQPFFHNGVNKEMVRSCHQLMEDYIMDTCPYVGYNCPRAEPEPPLSPVGVLDANSSCGSCDTHAEPPPTTEAAEPPNKPAQSHDPTEE